MKRIAALFIVLLAVMLVGCMENTYHAFSCDLDQETITYHPDSLTFESPGEMSLVMRMDVKEAMNIQKRVCREERLRRSHEEARERARLRYTRSD